MKKIIISLIIILGIWITIIKVEERGEEKTLIYKYANTAGRLFMSNYGGGQDLRVKVIKWHYNEDNDIKIKIEIYFNGDIFRSNEYEAHGDLLCTKDGYYKDFSISYVNNNFKKYANISKILDDSAKEYQQLMQQQFLNAH